MDITSIFLGRVFNKEASKERKLSSVSSNSSRYDDTPFALTSEHSEHGYEALANYYRGMEEDAEKESNWRDFKEDYDKRKEKKPAAIDRYVSNENQMKLYDNAALSKKMHEMFDEGQILTHEDEIAIMHSYSEGDSYIDRNSNVLKIVSITDNFAEVQINSHLGKFRNNTTKINRVDFLHRMKFQPGIMMQDYG